MLGRQVVWGGRLCFTCEKFHFRCVENPDGAPDPVITAPPRAERTGRPDFVATRKRHAPVSFVISTQQLGKF